MQTVTLKAVYNSIGQLVAEKWFNKDNTLIAHYKYVYDNSGNIVRSIDILGEKEYNYIYNEGSLIEAITYSIELNGEIVVGKSILNTLRYVYDDEDKQTKKILNLADGTEQVYLAADENNSTSEFIVGDNSIKTHSKTDSFGRKVFDEFQLGSGFISRQFSYHAGEETREHKENEKLMSSPTTQLVSEILLSDGRTLSYEYDAEERITSVTESYKTADNKTITNITEYTYDALGQLETETKDGVTTKFQYDNYGNITAKGVVDESGEIAPATKISYVYGNDTWKDLLTSYNGQSITYDAQGNPTSYLGHTLTWEKGRQLKSFDNNIYTYNANGIRTSKTVNGVKHEYTLDGTKILRETWGTNTLIPIYDSEDSVCGIIYNGTPHYFLKNLQGDIIAIANARGEVEARYTYDAWGAITNISGTDEGISIAVVNPFRYRGYYYDVEIGLYYLNSRFYNPIVGKYLNSDSPDIVLYARTSIGTNIFVYCANDCINNVDLIGYVSFRDIWGLIKNSFDFIKSILDQVEKSFSSTPTASQIKKLAKQNGKSQRQIIRELKQSAKESEKCLKWFGKAAIIAKIISIVLFAIHLIQLGKKIFYDIYELLVEVFVEAAGYVLGELVSFALKFIPYAGIILGFVGAWAIGLAISCYFTSKRKKKMTQAYASKMKNSTRWYDWIFGLFTSIGATF